MKNVLKFIPLYLLVICVYVLMITAFIGIENDIFFTILEAVIVLLWIVNLVYSVLLVFLMKDCGRSFLITTLVAKLLLVPIFTLFVVFVIFCALGVFIVPMFAVAALVAIPILILFAYALVLSTAPYAVGGMIKFYKNNKSPSLFVLTAVCCVCQFIFAADVVSLIVCLILAKPRAIIQQDI